jgi:oligopeptidase A
MDLDLHLFYNDNGGHLDEFIEKSIHSYTIPYEPKPISIIRQFLHLFSSSVGYAAGYYSYKWAEVLDADVFSRFQEKGIFNEKIANELRQKILERGNSEPADKLFFAFMGRNPDSNALLRRYDLLGER